MRSFPLLRFLGFVFQTSEKDSVISLRHGHHTRESSAPLGKMRANSAATVHEVKEKSFRRLHGAFV